MYSILIKVSANKYQYYVQVEETEPWTGTQEEAKTMFISLLNKYSLGDLKIVHNVNVDMTTIDINDVTE